MSTGAVIAIKTDAGNIKTIKCSSDGFPEPGYAGGTLNEHYKDAEKVQALIALGNIGSLAAEPSQMDSYIRDRGEPFEENKPLLFSSKTKLLKEQKSVYDAGYVYVYENGTWFVYQGSKWKLLSDVLARYTKEK
jgi:hypothetical protein